MRDPRLLQACALSRVDERREATNRLLAKVTTTDRAEIDCLLAEWWAEILAQDSPGEQWETLQIEDLRTKCSSLPFESRDLGLTAFNTLARNAPDEVRGIGALLLGESAATAVRDDSSAVALDRAVHFLSGCWEAIEVLMKALLRTPAWPKSMDTLATAGTALAGLLGHHFDRVPDHDILLEEESKARERGVSAYFWGQYCELYLNEPTLVRLSLLAARDWAAVALHADALPSRALRDDLWRHLHLHEDRDSILSLLRAAPPGFDDNKWTGSTSALAALSASITHADQLHNQLMRSYPPQPNADEKLKALVEREIPDWLETVAQAAIERPDGRLLLLLFGARLIHEALRPPWGGQRPWSSAQNALCAIHGVLDPTPSVAELRQVANLGGVPSNRTGIDHASYLVTSAACDSCANDVWIWYRQLLVQSDDDLCSQAKNWRRALCYEALAERLGQLSDPFQEWRAVWKLLFVTDREHARFATLDQNALYPSLHLLRVGAELLRQRPSRAGSRKFYEELLAHTHCLMANDARFMSPFTQELAFDAIDVAPHVLGSDWPRALEPHRPLLSVAKNRLYVATLLLEGGASFGDVEAAVEVVAHRLTDSIAELKQSKGMDLNDHRLCEIVAVAAKEHARTRTEGAP